MRSLRAGSLRLATPSSMASYSRFSRCSTSAVRLFSSACWQLDRVNGLRCAMGQEVQQGVGVERRDERPQVRDIGREARGPTCHSGDAV